MIKIYKLILSPFLGGHCRYYPSCSNYAIDAVTNLPLHKAILKIVYRVVRCNPFSKGGYDPITTDHKLR